MGRVASDEIVHDGRRGDVDKDACPVNPGAARDDETVHACIGAGIGDGDNNTVSATIENGEIHPEVTLSETGFGAVESTVHGHTGLECDQLGIDAAGDPELITGGGGCNRAWDSLFGLGPGRAGLGVVS